MAVHLSAEVAVSTRPRIILIVALVLVVFGEDYARAQSPAPRPNIVLIVADDLGNADLGYRGSD